MVQAGFFTQRGLPHPQDWQMKSGWQVSPAAHSASERQPGTQVCWHWLSWPHTSPAGHWLLSTQFFPH